jgi:ribose 1,5-bisphosphokinase
MPAGVLALVVGPSGAGKDSLIRGARSALVGDDRFVFPRRVVTREATPELEDHDTLSPEAFARARNDGAFALSWTAHGLDYGVPAGIADQLASGRVVVVNGSRRAVTAAVERFQNVRVLLVDAEPAIRAGRLAGRGREDEAEVAARLARDAGRLPSGVAATSIDNSGTLDEGVTRFVEALRRLAE